MFTGDASGDFLFAALHRAGLASSPVSRRADDGLRLFGAYIAAAVRCAPPANKPTPDERDRCAPFLARELALLADVRVVVALGAFGWDAAVRALAPGPAAATALRAWRRGAPRAVPCSGTYHPSQQNTFTGTLTPPMLDAVLAHAVELAGAP